jgi:hypothetical protein
MRIPDTTLLVEAGLIMALAFTPCAKGQQIATGQAAFADWNQQQPGARHRITVADLPEPNPQEAVNNTPQLVPRPKDVWPIAPAGFQVTLYAGGDATPCNVLTTRSTCN